MRKFRYVLVAALASACSFGIAATTGWASKEQVTRFFTARVGDSVTFKGVDLFCSLNSHDSSASNDPGPALYCARYSSETSSGSSRATVTTLYHYAISDESGARRAYLVSRAP